MVKMSEWYCRQISGCVNVMEIMTKYIENGSCMRPISEWNGSNSNVSRKSIDKIKCRKMLNGSTCREASKRMNKSKRWRRRKNRLRRKATKYNAHNITKKNIYELWDGLSTFVSFNFCCTQVTSDFLVMVS